MCWKTKYCLLSDSYVMDSHRQCGIVTWTFIPHIMLWTLISHGSKWIRGYHDRIGVNYSNMGWYPKILEVTLRLRNRTCRGRQWQPGEDIVDGQTPSKFCIGASLITIPALFVNRIVATAHFSMLSHHLSMYRLIEQRHIVNSRNSE